MKNEITATIAANQITVVAGDTGCGSEYSKSSAVLVSPMFLLPFSHDLSCPPSEVSAVCWALVISGFDCTLSDCRLLSDNASATTRT